MGNAQSRAVGTRVRARTVSSHAVKDPDACVNENILMRLPPNITTSQAFSMAAVTGRESATCK